MHTTSTPSKSANPRPAVNRPQQATPQPARGTKTPSNPSSRPTPPRADGVSLSTEARTPDEIVSTVNGLLEGLSTNFMTAEVLAKRGLHTNASAGAALNSGSLPAPVFGAQ